MWFTKSWIPSLHNNPKLIITLFDSWTLLLIPLHRDYIYGYNKYKFVIILNFTKKTKKKEHENRDMQHLNKH